MRILAFALLGSLPAAILAAPAAADRREQALEYFEQAVQQRQQLERIPEAERTRAAYQKAAYAFRRVYHTSPQSSKADDAILAEADLYLEMSRRFQAPELQARAAETYRFLVQQYPHSVLVKQAHARLAEIDAGPAAAVQSPPAAQPAAGRSGPGPAAAGSALAMVTDVRHWSLPDLTRVIVTLESEASVKPERLTNPDRIYFDIPDSRLGPLLKSKKTLPVGDERVRQIRVAQTQLTVTRVVLDLAADCEYALSSLSNPSRLVLELKVRKPINPLLTKSEPATKATQAATAPPPAVPPPAGKPQPSPAGRSPAPQSLPERPAAAAPAGPPAGTQSSAAPDGAGRTAAPPAGKDEHRAAGPPAGKPAPEVSAAQSPPQPSPAGRSPGRQRPPELPAIREQVPAAAPGPGQDSRERASIGPSAKAPLSSSDVPGAGGQVPTPQAQAAESEAGRAAGGATGSGPRVGAKGHLAPAPAGESAAGESRTAVAPSNSAAPPLMAAAAPPVPAAPTIPEPRNAPAPPAPDLKVESPKPAAAAGAAPTGSVGQSGRTRKPALPPPQPAKLTPPRDQNLIRALGLKISRVVIDPGHGGHDTGTIGPTGLMEKDLALDIATRLGDLIRQRIGAEVVYTRTEDVFVPLEERTALANEKQADLFISIHGNSSRAPSARGIETYYLNLTTDRDALELAARENAASNKSIHDLQELLTKITLSEKIAESREFAFHVQRSLVASMTRESPAQRNRGVRKAPFVVLVGARMPAVLAEISFLSNPRDERLLKTSAHRQRVAQALFEGVAGYAKTLSRVEVAARD